MCVGPEHSLTETEIPGSRPLAGDHGLGDLTAFGTNRNQADEKTQRTMPENYLLILTFNINFSKHRGQGIIIIICCKTYNQ
jgi:hypothetical protein